MIRVHSILPLLLVACQVGCGGGGTVAASPPSVLALQTRAAAAAKWEVIVHERNLRFELTAKEAIADCVRDLVSSQGFREMSGAVNAVPIEIRLVNSEPNQSVDTFSVVGDRCMNEVSGQGYMATLDSEALYTRLLLIADKTGR